MRYVILLGMPLVAFGQDAAPDGGQPRAASSTYAHDAGLSPLVSAVSVSSSYAHRAGYVGQLTDVVSIEASATMNPAPEATVVPLALATVNDDGTITSLAGPALGSVSWSILGAGSPVLSVNAVPAAVLGNVYQNTTASLRATYGGMQQDFSFMVSNTGDDDFGAYAGDGLDDAWQVGYFGIGNPAAAPDADPDGDGQDNRFEFLSGYSPVDGGSFFRLLITGKSPSAAQMRLSRVLPTTSYFVEASDTLGQPWIPEVTLKPEIGMDDFSFSVPSTASRNFFRVRLEPR